MTNTTPKTHWCLDIEHFEARSAAVSLCIPNLKIPQGAFCALLAKSGAGKSILLSVLTGHLLGPWMRKKEAIRFDRFRVGSTVLHQNAFASPARLRGIMRDENLVYLPQKFPEDRSMERQCLHEMADIVCAIALLCPRRTAEQKLAEKCRELGLQNNLNQPLKDLSGGERKRIEIIARLTGLQLRTGEETTGEVLFLLDEPTTGLDAAAQRAYFLFLKETRQLFAGIEITFVIATHALSLLTEPTGECEQPIFDHVIYAEKDVDADCEKRCRVVYCGPVNAFVRSDFFTELHGQPSGLKEPMNVNGAGAGREGIGDTASSSVAAPSRPPRRSLKVVLATFGGELRRAYGKQFEGKGKRAVFGIPFFVGLIVFAAFLGRETPNAERFIFFTTIYAFWIGIFNSCQIVNGAVASGEWNYWVLALRRSFLGYLSANAAVSFLLSLAQTTVFAGAILLLTAAWNESSLHHVFIGKSSLPDIPNDFFFLSPSVVICVLFFSSLIMAVLAGIGLGTLISSVAKDTLGALKIAVGVMVACMVSSSTVLKPETGGRRIECHLLYFKCFFPSPFLSSPPEFPPRKTSDSASKVTDFYPHLLEDISFALPQRFFFNIGRALHTDVLECPKVPTPKDSPYVLQRGPGDAKTPASLQPLAEKWSKYKDAGWADNTKPADLKKAKNASSREVWRVLIDVLRKIVGLEALACLSLSAVYFCAGWLITDNRKGNYEIH